MEPLADYARFWIRRTALRIGHPNWMRLNQYWVDQIESGRPGFNAALRNAALETLDSGDTIVMQKALAALAIVGEVDDVGQISTIGESGDEQTAKYARTAVYEIEHRTSVK